jgi:hypothetical protein
VVVASYEVQSRHLSGGTEGKHQKFQSRYVSSGPRFEPGTSRIGNKSSNHSTDTFSKVSQNAVVLISYRVMCL